MVGRWYWKCQRRAVARYENIIWWAQSALLVEIELTDLPKSGGAMPRPAPPGTTGLQRYADFTQARLWA